jgi:hypothetical protein
VSIRSVTPVATGTTAVFHSDPVTRFQERVDISLQVRDLERRVQHLARLLGSADPVHPGPARDEFWWPAS